MPPFSAKKKKEQLQAKRQRKRDEVERSNALERERENLREELVGRGLEVNEDVLDAYMGERHPRLREPAHGRRAQRKMRELNKAAPPAAAGGKKSSESDGGVHVSSDRNDSEGEEKGGRMGHTDTNADTQMYSADRQHGVRSVFARESPAVLAARKQLSYKPIPFRTTMPVTGIPFSKWFTFPSHVTSPTPNALCRAEGEEAVATRCNKEKDALFAAEEQSRLDRPLVATMAEALGGGSGSVVFPFAVELPSRGWRVRDDGDDTTNSLDVGLGAEVEVTSNTLTFSAGLAAPPSEKEADAGEEVETAEGTAEPETERNSCKSDAGSTSGDSNGEESHEEEKINVAPSSSSNSTGEDGEEQGATGAKSASADAQRADALVIKKIERRRFETYVQFLDAYPLPKAIAGLDINSYERNLEVWQQLWRTVELSDVLVVVADARYPILHAHLGLLTYITKEQRKPCVFVLNKEDLVPASTLRCWQRFLYLYLTDLGFSVEALEGTGEADEEKGEGSSGTTRNNRNQEASNTCGQIVLRTFTANPRPETAGQQDGDVDVTHRQKHRRGIDAKMYERLRTGKLNVAKHLGRQQYRHLQHIHGGSGCSASASSSDDNSDEESGESDELRYSAHENFVGMRAAEHALQHDRRAYKELEVVAQKITELLAVCRRLGHEGRAARGGKSSAAAFVASPTAEDAIADNNNPTTQLRCLAQRAAPKNKKAQKSSGARRGEKKERGIGDGGASAEAEDGDDGASDENVAEDRAPDSPTYVHIGFIGHPNVGKSSLLNCIRGTKVVSVSATPGHTKHIQTIPVPEEKLTLIDSPGLALPVFGVPRPLQAVLGTHQIAQTRDPQSGVSFLAAYLPIEKLYGLQRPDYALKEDEWSSYELCEAYAKKRGYYVKHGKGTPDIHRAAIAILQEAYEGRLTLFYAPPELNLLQSAWYRECIRPRLLLPVFGPPLQ